MLLKKKDLIEFEEYVIDRVGWTLRWREEPIALNRKSFDLLIYLIDHRDRVLKKDELLQALWPEQFVEESNLTQQIFLLRKALSRHESGRKIIETLSGRGYRFLATIENEEPETADYVQHQIVLNARESVTQITVEEDFDDSDLERLAPQTGERKRRIGVIAACAFAAVALVAGSWFGWQYWLDRSFAPPVQVVLTALEGSTGDLVLDRALVATLRMDLSQSPFVSLVSNGMVTSTLSEMKRKPDDGMTPAIARDVCERTNSQAVLHTTVARNGQHYLLTEEATSCVDGSTLAAATQVADRSEDLPHSIDKLAAAIRQKLGESRRSVARFTARLSPATTASLEALKAYSEASRLAEQGKLPEAIDLLKKSVADDPGFAAAWNDLWAYYASVNGDPISGREAILKAYSLRDSAGSQEWLTITAHYDMVVIGDLFESERNYQTWTQLYPRSIPAWNGLSVIQGQLGQFPEAVVSATRALALRPKYAGLSLNLALAQLSTGDEQAARATCESAFAQGVESDHLRGACLSIAYVIQDSAMLKRQRDWAAAHPKCPLFTVTEANIAIAEGRFADARKLIAHATDLMRQQGLGSQADSYTRSLGINLIETGDVEAGTRMLRSSPADPESGSDLIGLAEIGDIPGATSGIEAMEKEHPQGTLWKMYWIPMTRAAIAIASQKPGEAAALFEATPTLDTKGIDLPMRRGLSYLAAGQPALAEKDFRFILAHHDLDPTASTYPLAWFQLGRDLAAQGNRAAAADAFRQFLNLWAHADPDATLLRRARQELTGLKQN